MVYLVSLLLQDKATSQHSHRSYQQINTHLHLCPGLFLLKMWLKLRSIHLKPTAFYKPDNLGL